MATISIDGVEYDIESMSESARAQLASLQATDTKILHTQGDLAILQTARNAYAQALAALLQESEEE